MKEEIPATSRPESSRRGRLAAILARWPGSSPPPQEIPRFAALTSPGPPEAEPIPGPTLVLAEDPVELGERLRVEIEEGRLAHGRVWDLDSTVYPWGNLAIAYEVRVGEELVRPVHAVSVVGRDGGLYLFADKLDAEAFCRAVRRRDGRAEITVELLHDNGAADRLIDAERAG